MVKLYYVLVSVGVAKFSKLGPYLTDTERDRTARETWAEMDQETSNVFWLDVDPANISDPVLIGGYTEAELTGE